MADNTTSTSSVPTSPLDQLTLDTDVAKPTGILKTPTTSTTDCLVDSEALKEIVERETKAMAGSAVESDSDEEDIKFSDKLSAYANSPVPSSRRFSVGAASTGGASARTAGDDDESEDDMDIPDIALLDEEPALLNPKRKSVTFNKQAKVIDTEGEDEEQDSNVVEGAEAVTTAKSAVNTE